MQTVTIIGPNTPDGLIHVHASGCGDIKRFMTRNRLSRWEMYEAQVASELDATFNFWQDILNENVGVEGERFSTFYEAAKSYRRTEMKFHGCLKGLPYEVEADKVR